MNTVQMTAGTYKQRFKTVLLSLDRLKAQNIINEQIDKRGVPEIIDKLIVPVLEEIGEDWVEGRLALSQVYMSGRITEEIIEGLLPKNQDKMSIKQKIAICVLEDHHYLGKRIVSSILRSGAYELLDYGYCKVEQLAEYIKRDNIRILLISVLMLPSALRIKKLKSLLPSSVKIVVGGAPFRFDSNLWKEVGADAMGRTASDALSIVKSLTEETDEQ